MDTLPFSNIRYIQDCSNIMHIPSIRGISVLHVSNCLNLTSIDNSHIDALVIYNCPSLTIIPPSVYELSIDGSTKVQYIPLQTLRYFTPMNTKRYIETQFILPRIDLLRRFHTVKKNRQLLISLQRWCRKHIIYWRFCRWIKSRDFFVWFYRPSGIGGKMAIRRIEQFCNSINETK
jgi:hypothetical protein